MTGTTFRMNGLDVERLGSDGDYRIRLARRLLSEAGTDVDHVQLRRVAVEVFPEIGRREAAPLLARLVGAASTLQRQIRSGREALVREPAPDPSQSAAADEDPTLRIVYPADYRDMDMRTKNIVIRFCDARLIEGDEGRDALDQLTRRYGWPYTDRTFYVGPWKAARLRRRKRDARRAALEAREASRRGAPAAARDAGDPDPDDDDLQPLDDGGADRDATAGAGSSAPGGDVRASRTRFPESFEDEREIRFSTEQADYSAHRLESGEWAVHVRARLDTARMRRLHAQAADLFFPHLGDH